MRMVIELRRGEIADVVLNNLYTHTLMQREIGNNNVALVEGQPRVLNLKQLIESFLRHRREVVTRRAIFDLRKARDRAHVLEGLAVALGNIDAVIALIKAARSPAEARAALEERTWPPGAVTAMLAHVEESLTRPEGLSSDRGLRLGAYRLSEVQSKAILDLQLQRLTGLEQEKILEEYGGLIASIRDLLDILGNPARLTTVIREELQALRAGFADERRTEIIREQLDLTVEDLIEEADVVVTLSHAGYAKAQPVSDYQAQRRGGRGKAATRVKDEDFIDKLFVANTHDTLLCFTSRGKVYWLKVYELPVAARGARGRPMVNLLPLEAEERINAVLPVRDFGEGHYVFMATSAGTVKKTPIDAFSRPRRDGIIALDLRPDDRLVDVALTDGSQHVLLCASNGKAIRFSERDVRPMGRTAAGVRGMRLQPGQELIALIMVEPASTTGMVLTATENGYGKRTPVDEFPLHGRGGQGVIAIQTSERNGRMVAARLVAEEDEIMLISSGGTLVRTVVSEISVLGRNTQGVRLIRLDEGDSLAGLERVEAVEEEGDAAE
jgi:DNA gyrase subunit A